MAWETVEPIKTTTAATPSVPPKGLVITVRQLNARRNAAMPARKYIALRIGAELAKASAIAANPAFVRIMIGSGSDANRIKVQVDHAAAGNPGCFLAKRQSNGGYLVSINQPSAEGLFAMNFPAITITSAEVVRPENGQPVFFHFKPDAALFAVEED